LEEAQEEVDELSSNVAFKWEGIHATLRNQMVIDLLNENFVNIPIDELEKFIEQYKK